MEAKDVCLEGPSSHRLAILVHSLAMETVSPTMLADLPVLCSEYVSGVREPCFAGVVPGRQVAGPNSLCHL